MLTPAFLFYKAYPIPIIHFSHNPCLAFKAWLLGMVIMYIKRIMTINPVCDILLTKKRYALSALLLYSMPTLMFESVNKLIKVSLVKSLAHHDESPWNVVVPI